MNVDGVEIMPRDYRALKQYYEITSALYQKAKTENEMFRRWFIELTEKILAEIDKDGWCRLVVDPEYVEKMRTELKLFKEGTA